MKKLITTLALLVLATSAIAQNTGDRFVVTVNTISDMQGLNPSVLHVRDGKTVKVREDGQGGIFVYDASSGATTDGGIVFDATHSNAPADARFLREYHGPINVKWFGAVGDGSTDNANAFANASNAVPDGGGVGTEGETIYVPPGHYVIGSQIIFGEIGTTLRGAGINATRISPAAGFTDDSLFRWQIQGGPNQFEGASLRDMTIRMNGEAAHGVEIFKAYDNTRIDNVAITKVEDAHSALRIEPDPNIVDNTSQSVTVSALTVEYNSSSASGDLVYLEEVNETTFTNVKAFGGDSSGTNSATMFRIRDCRGVQFYGGAATSAGNGFVVESGGSITPNNITLDSQTFENIGRALDVQGTASDKAKQVYLLRPRVQNLNPDVNLDHVTLSEVDAQGMAVTVGSGCNQAHIVTDAYSNVTDNGTDTSIWAWRNGSRDQIETDNFLTQGDMTVSGLFRVGGGVQMDLINSATASLDFGSIADGAQAELTISVGAVNTGDAVSLGLPPGADSGLTFDGYVSSGGTVTVRATNIADGGGAIDPPSRTYRATVISY